ncbi:CcdB family protein [Serratia sp. T13T92]|jgi:toxin CcdB|uniref:CcdB family protein n=1 Tax=Serratia TaxID=613 RepID=UPI0015C6443F|nr:CcdB family protein [Serratia fonticola]NXZ85694.1 CcdB family protein [Serratia fonticola]
MKQFSVYKNQSKNKKNYPFFIVVQSDLLDHLSTRLVMPLALKHATNSQVKTLTPVLSVDQQDYVILTSLLTTTDVKNLNADCLVTNAAHLRDELVAAIDLLVLGI